MELLAPADLRRISSLRSMQEQMLCILVGNASARENLRAISLMRR